MMNVFSCFFPTTIVLVDDSSVFLESLKDCLDVKYVTFKSFSNPVEAVDYVNEVTSTNRLDYTDLVRDGEDSLSDWKSILLNINYLHREIYNPYRFSRISTIIVDYLMPGMDGIDLCSRIDDKSIQRILLTGVADEKIAIDAFNEGKINRFVKKGTFSFENEVTDSIYKSVNQYFRIHTEDISKHLSVLDRGHLSDPIFADFFFSKCFCGDMIEYYMLDTFGSYLIMNEVGKMSMLSILTEHELCRLIEIGIESEEISGEVLNKLQSRKYILVSHERTGLLPPVLQWSKYLREAHRLDGYQTYYFAISNEQSLDVDFNDVQTFYNFKRRWDF
ncbi:MAG: response regulator [Holosporaceae bacterium]|nr:response regulator [Holosporaceae bacterium]